MIKWYYLKNEKKKGPFTIEELATKNINPDTLVWNDTMKDWEKAKHIQPLKNIIITPPPPIPNKNENKTEQSKPLENDYFGYDLAKKRYRFFATMVEAIILTAVFVFLIITSHMVVESEDTSLASYFSFVAFANAIIWGAISGALFYPNFSGNLGHKIFGLKVISAETGEDYNTAKKGMSREILKYLLDFFIIANAWILFDKKNQNIYDKITKTYVVKVKKN